MKPEEVRQRLEPLSAEDLRLVAAQLYKMLQKNGRRKRGGPVALRSSRLSEISQGREIAEIDSAIALQEKLFGRPRSVNLDDGGIFPHFKTTNFNGLAVDFDF